MKLAWASFRALRTAQYVAIVANGIYNGGFNVAVTSFHPMLAFFIGFLGGAIGMWISFRDPVMGAMFTNAFIEVNNEIFDGDQMTFGELQAMTATTLLSGGLAGALAKIPGGSIEVVREAVEKFLIQFDTQILTNVMRALAP